MSSKKKMPASDGKQQEKPASKSVILSRDAIKDLAGAAHYYGTDEDEWLLNDRRGEGAVILGHGGNDRLVGGDSNDALDGGSGNDVLDGGFGHDDLVGGDGDDTLRGEEGDDMLTGGAGRDAFVFCGQGGSENDIILDFNPTEDTIKLDAVREISYLSAENRFVYVSANGATSTISLHYLDAPLTEDQIKQCVTATDGYGNAVPVRMA